MRGPSLEMPAGMLEQLAEGGKPLPPPITRSGRLNDAGNGRGQVDDLVTTATVARDGSVSFHDKPNLDYKFHVPVIPTPSGIIESAREAGKQLGEWYSDPYEQTRYGQSQDLPAHLQAEGPGVQCASWGDTSCDDASAPKFEQRMRANMTGQLGINGTFDLTAALMKKFHAGDAWSARKQRILDETFDERAEKSAAFRSDQLAHASQDMQRNLERLWATVADPASRREALFAMWDECDEGEDARGAAGAEARAMVIGWIRAHLPAGSPDAFSSAEIASLCARRTSHALFAPY